MENNIIQLVSIFAAAMAVSFGAIGPALGEGRAVASAMDCDSPAARFRRHRLAHPLCRARDDRDHGDLRVGDRAAGALRQSIREVSAGTDADRLVDAGASGGQRPRPIWLLAHFLFRPVVDAIAARQKAAGQLLADAKAAKAAAEGERDKPAAETARLAEHRSEALKAAEAEAATAKSALLAAAQA